MVIELKVGDFDPSFLGQLGMYMAAVDDLLRHADDRPTIGLILCKTKNNVVAEYALRADTPRPSAFRNGRPPSPRACPPSSKPVFPQSKNSKPSSIARPTKETHHDLGEDGPATLGAVSLEMNAAWLSICGSTACGCSASPTGDPDRIVSMFHLRGVVQRVTRMSLGTCPKRCRLDRADNGLQWHTFDDRTGETSVHSLMNHPAHERFGHRVHRRPMRRSHRSQITLGGSGLRTPAGCPAAGHVNSSSG